MHCPPSPEESNSDSTYYKELVYISDITLFLAVLATFNDFITYSKFTVLERSLSGIYSGDKVPSCIVLALLADILIFTCVLVF